MKYLFFILMIISIQYCHPKQAGKFDLFLDSIENRAIRTLISDGSEKKRLRALVDKKPAEAISSTNLQIKALTELIEKIKITDVTGIKDAEILKLRTIAYYEALLALKKIDLTEAELMLESLKNDSITARQANMQIAELPTKRLKIYERLAAIDLNMVKERGRFNESNDIR